MSKTRWKIGQITELQWNLTITLPLGAGTPEGKHFTCNVCIISMRFFPSEAWLLSCQRLVIFNDASSRNYFFFNFKSFSAWIPKKWIKPFEWNKTVKWVVLIWKSQLVSVADGEGEVIQNQILIPRFVLLDHFSWVNIWIYVLSWP